MILPLSTTTTRAVSTKTLWILRHGQAMHNPRAEVARDAGCSKAEFLEFMRLDDVLDAPLTELGKEQARSAALQSCIQPDVVIASPLSRALETADIACADCSQRVCYEGFREINGWLLNAQRRTKTELKTLFPAWDFDNLQTDEDVLWEPTLEEEEACAARGYEGLKWMTQRFTEEQSILLVVHGGLLSFLMRLEPRVTMKDERSVSERSVSARFSNCELRRYKLEVERKQIILTEVDLEASS